jgi:hypothetical protein
MSYVAMFIIVSVVFAVAGFGAGFYYHDKITKWLKRKKAAVKEKL